MNILNKDYVKITKARDIKFLEDEYKNIISLQERGVYPLEYEFPVTLQFELTTHCNVYCKHCYNNSGCNSNVDKMTPEKWKSFARYLVERGGIFQCVISGGEPLLLGDDVFEIMDILHDDGTSFLVISNGFLMTPKKAEKFSKYRYKWFQISIDGNTSQIHDEFRQRDGSWEKAVNAAILLSNEGIPLTIAHTVTPCNYINVDKMCHLAYQLGAGSIILGEVNPSGRSANNLDLTLNYKQKNIFYKMVDELIDYYSGKMLVQRSSSTKNQLTRYQNTPNSGAIIRPNGDVRIDCMAPFTIGNILEDDFEYIWESKAKDCWKDSRVIEYINGFNDNDVNDNYKNYFDKDVRL